MKEYFLPSRSERIFKMTKPELFSTWSYPTEVRFGVGRISEIGDACSALNIKRPLIVTDTGLANSEIIKNLTELIETGDLKMGLFSKVQGNPVGKNIEEGTAAFRSGSHDGVIAIGGGSAMDAGKVIAMYQGQKGNLFDLHVKVEGGPKINLDNIVPIIAVPTTAGTGSETGRAGLITDEEVNAKLIFAHPKMMPAIVIEDPQLSVGLPPNLTAWTGIDALAHSFEALCAPGIHPMADGIALEGMRLVKEYLPRSYADGDDLEARGYMLAAASMGSTAFQKGLGGIHSLSHSIGALYNTHHGLTNAVFFPYVMDFNRIAIEEKMIRVSAYLGLKKFGFEAVRDWILETRDFFSIPHSISEMDIDDSDIDRIGVLSAADPTASSNPIELNEVAARQVFLKSLEGKIDF